MVSSLTYEEASKYFSYNPVTGVLRWKVNKRPGGAGDEAGGINTLGYRKVKVNGDMYLAHRIAWLLAYGEFPKKCIDHINQDPADNRLVNLRTVGQAENCLNKKRHSDNKSGVMGVRWVAKSKVWQVTIGFNKKSKYLGRTPDFFEACCIRKSAEAELGFHPNHGIDR